MAQTMKAKFRSHCPLCKSVIGAGQTIVKIRTIGGSKWVCLTCESRTQPDLSGAELRERDLDREIQAERGRHGYWARESAGERAERSMRDSGGRSDCLYDS